MEEGISDVIICTSNLLQHYIYGSAAVKKQGLNELNEQLVGRVT